MLILLFRGSVTGLLPLYGIGVFTAFTLSQAALVALVARWWRRLHHYILIPVPDLNRAATHAIAYAESLTAGAAPTATASPGQERAGNAVVIQAIHVTDDADHADQLQEKWERYAPGVQLVIIEAPYRTLVGPLLRYADAVGHSSRPAHSAAASAAAPSCASTYPPASSVCSNPCALLRGSASSPVISAKLVPSGRAASSSSSSSSISDRWADFTGSPARSGARPPSESSATNGRRAIDGPPTADVPSLWFIMLAPCSPM